MASRPAVRFRALATRLVVAVLTIVGAALPAHPSGSAPAAVGASARSQAKATQIVIRFRGPKSVPSSVRLVGRTKTAVTFDPDGPRVVRAVVKPGPYTVKAASAVSDGKTFVPVLSRSKVRVARGGTTTVTVNMRRARFAIDLAGAGLTPTSATLVWRAPRGAEVRLRRASGERSLRSVTAGQAVKLSASDARRRRTTDGRLEPGSSYTYSLFSRSPGGRWMPSPGLTMSTPAVGAPAYAVKPSTLLLTQDDSDRASMGADGTAVVAARGSATLGAAVVLPPSATMPTGYLGRVASILPNGSLQLEPGDFASVFDYFDGSFDLSSVPVQVDGVTVDARGRARRAGSGGVGWGCELSSGVDLRPYYKAGGYFSPHVDWSPWHTSGEISLDVEMSPTIGVDITTTTSAACGVSAGVSQTFMAGPVPIYVGAEFFGNVSASGSQKVSYRLKLGRQIKAQFKDGQFSVPLNRRIFEPSETLSSNGSLSFELGSQVTFGPGVGNRDVAGVVAGINGTMSYFKRSLTTTRGACATVDQTSGASLGLKASAWVGPLAASTYLNLVNEQMSHEGYPRTLSGCTSNPTPTPSPTSTPTVTPTTPPSSGTPGQWAQIAPSDGSQFTCGITTSSDLWCWGRNDSGTLGNGTTSPYETTPQKVPGTGWASVDTSTQHACAVRVDGSAWCWGAGHHGQLGNGSPDQQLSPAQVLGSGWSSLRLGGSSTCGLKTDGSLWCWGQYLGGTNATTPTKVDDHQWSAVDVGISHACAIRSSGAVYCWGMNNLGQLGDGTRGDRYSPTPVAGLSDGSATAISAGFAHTCARGSSQVLSCWGYNWYGQLGIGAVGSDQYNAELTPRTVPGAGWTQFEASNNETCGVKSDSSGWCWGEGWFGQLGLGSEENKSTPTQLAGSWRSIQTGAHAACGIKTDGSAWCWGHNAYGQAGDGSTDDQWLPVQVMLPG